MKSIHIVTTHATQFDGPLFRWLNRQQDGRVKLFFTKSRNARCSDRDKELGRVPQWDNATEGFEYVETDDPHFFAQWRIVRQALREPAVLTVFFGYNRPAYLLGAIWGRLCGKKVALRTDSVLLYGRPGGLRGVAKAILLPWLLRIYQVIFCTSSLTQECMQYYRVPAKRLFLWPYNIDNEAFYRTQTERKAEVDELKMQLGLGKAFVILGVMKFVERENPRVLVRAFCELFRNNPETRLIMVGCGELEPQLRALIPEDVRHAVLFPGFVPYGQLPLYFAVSQVFVHPARVEQWGCSVNEAMCSGIPAVVADTVGAGYDLVRRGETGYVFPVDDHLELARILLTLSHDPAGTAAMGGNARRVIEHWEYKDIAVSLDRALEYLA